MKKQLNCILTAAAAILLYSCSDYSADIKIPEPESVESGQYQALIRLADDAMESVYPEKSRTSARVAKSAGVKFVTELRSRGEADTLIYVVNYENDNGFVLLSATNEESPILAVVPKGNYNPAVVTDNPGFNIFMELAKEEAASHDGNTLEKFAESGISTLADDTAYLGADGRYHKTTRIRVGYVDVEPWLGEEFKWGEHMLYGAYCPNGLCGCVPLTIGSIATYMFHFGNPDQYITYKFPEADKNYEKLDYEDMFRHKSELTFDFHTGKHIVSENCAVQNEESHKMIGRFLRQIGVSCEASYINEDDAIKTDVSLDAALRELKNYLYPHYVSEWEKFIIYDVADAIDYGVIMVYAHVPSIGGHVWLCDGVKYSKYEVTEYAWDVDSNGNAVNMDVIFSYIEYTNLNYMHWGRSGERDGWFSGTPFMYDNQPLNDVKYAAVEFIDLP